MNLKTIASSVRDLAKQIAALELPEAKTFDAARLRAAFEGTGIDVEAHVARAEKEFVSIHGDVETQNRKAVRDLINDHMRALYESEGLNNLKTPSERKESVRLTDDQKKQVVDLRRAYLTEKAKPENEQDKHVMATGQAGAIADKFNVSIPTLQKLFDEAGLVTKRLAK